MQTIKEKMIPAFRDANGGLFQAVEKADVGSAYQDLEKQGVALMGWADPFMPDRSLPEPVAAAWLDAVRAESAPHYTAPIGDPALKAALAKKLKQQNGLTVDPERNILITPGSDSGLYFAILPFVGQGDEVLIPSPSYPNNFLDVKIMGGVPVAVELDAADGYQLSRAQLEAHSDRFQLFQRHGTERDACGLHRLLRPDHGFHVRQRRRRDRCHLHLRPEGCTGCTGASGVHAGVCPRL